MRYRKALIASLLVLLTLTTLGCARAARDTTGFALHEGATVNASFEDTWQTVKRVLREKEYEVYTRDKRGVFVAFTPMKRSLLQPRRTKLTITIEPEQAGGTAIQIETIRQVYGVTLLTYPDWHDRKASNSDAAKDILAAIQAAAPQS